jgi:hypothetical protein
VVSAALEHEVKILVALLSDKRHRRLNTKDASLRWKPRGERDARWPRQVHKVRDRRDARTQEPWTVLQRFDLPALDAAGEGCR